MGKPRPWWETHPRKYWTAEDWRAARKAGVVPPEPQPDIDGPIRPLVPQGQVEAVLPGGLWGNPDANRAAERRRKANQALEKAGLRPAPWT